MTGRGGDCVVLLGTKGGPAIRPGSSMPASSLVCMNGRRIVVDCGLGVARALANQGMNLRELSTIFITHLHADHYLELGALVYTAWASGLKTPVTVWGPAGLRNYWDHFLAAMDADVALRIDDEGRPVLRALVRIRELDEGPVSDIAGIEVRALRVRHPPLRDCFALSFRSSTAHVVFSADTAYCPPLADFAHKADLLVHEAMLEDALEPLLARIGNGDDRLMQHWLRSHTRAADAAKIASAAQVGALTLSPLIPADDPDFGEADWLNAVRPHWSGTFHLGFDGLTIQIRA